jgi:hypothetical protein
MHNLIGAFRTTLARVPIAVPYVHVDTVLAAAWRERMASQTGFRVGLYWDDHPKHWRDQRRSVTVEQMLTLSGQPSTAYFSLRKGLDTPVPGLTDWSSELNDLADTAALIENLDLVITVDSAVAHLAGALGKPVWLLSRFDAEWVWLEERADSQWYPTLTLFRQPRAGDWATVLKNVSAQVEMLVAERVKQGGAGVEAAAKKAKGHKATAAKKRRSGR